MPGQQGPVHLVPRLLADPERVPVPERSRDRQGLEALHPPLRQVHEAAADQGDPQHAPAHLRLRGVQDIIASGK